MSKKGNQPYYDWIDLHTRWLMSKAVTLESFFSEVGIPMDTWKKHTKTWHAERTAYRLKLGDDTLEQHKAMVAKTVSRQSQYGAAGLAATFKKLFTQTTDPKTGEKTLMVSQKVDDRAVVRLLDIVAKMEREAVKLNAPEESGGQGGARPGRLNTERELLDRISADPKAMKAAEALYKALPKE